MSSCTWRKTKEIAGQSRDSFVFGAGSSGMATEAGNTALAIPEISLYKHWKWSGMHKGGKMIDTRRIHVWKAGLGRVMEQSMQKVSICCTGLWYSCLWQVPIGFCPVDKMPLPRENWTVFWYLQCLHHIFYPGVRDICMNYPKILFRAYSVVLLATRETLLQGYLKLSVS